MTKITKIFSRILSRIGALFSQSWPYFGKNKYSNMCLIIFFCIILFMLESLSEGTTQKMKPTVDRSGIANLSQELSCVLR